MALLKTITNEKGVTTTYHKVNDVSLYNNTLNCFMESYVSEEYRNAGYSADSLIFTFNITVEEEESMGIRALCYTKIKELQEWQDAQDC